MVSLTAYQTTTVGKTVGKLVKRTPHLPTAGDEDEQIVS